MDMQIVAAASVGCAFGLMFKMVIDAIESHYKMKMMICGALENAQKMQDK